MLPDRVSKPGPLTYESGALPIALGGPANSGGLSSLIMTVFPKTGGSCNSAKITPCII